ncbi:sulfite exporter TauE/SafE family protein [Chelativorans sp. AA-79]|uniref:sulfite exporter TauE/SafE family protein n=1 Tax=Chelativorans sp. AA-79 TaxID=3028735 RepID=UPI0023FA33AA|nr:sulfite exporter TauE/SafE family protein [Chelativorans sp. AA-79]WEX08479.1 sulfite exporter TauE/SafE family protein [Chelativorans sp. AA-79]
MQDFLLFAGVGFLAQIIDGALGMAYGVVCSTVLLSFGVPPAHASASVHAAELFTTAASGSAHLYHRNIDWRLFVRLAPFGIIGGCIGAYVLTSFDGNVVKPFVTTYLALVGCWLIFRSFRKIPSNPVPIKVIAPLGAAGGFLDAAGGGGWGPIVTTGLLGAGAPPRYVIGTVNASEFLIATAVSLSFLIALLSGHWQAAGSYLEHAAAVVGLVFGGILAAPFAGWVTKSLKERFLLRAIGCLIVLLATWQTLQLVGVA